MVIVTDGNQETNVTTIVLRIGSVAPFLVHDYSDNSFSLSEVFCFDVDLKVGLTVEIAFD